VRKQLRSALFIAAAMFSAAASAQQADRPPIEVGDRWEFVVWYSVPATTPNRIWIVTGTAHDGIDATENGEPLRLTVDLGVLDGPTQASSNPRPLDFPLTVGKRWEYDNRWTFKPKRSKGSARVDVVVAAYESVRVPAGTFDAFRLESRERLSGMSPINSRYDGETTRTYWYAPAARAIVKTVSRNPYLGPSTIELTSFALRP
jgi:hypothetical protein